LLRQLCQQHPGEDIAGLMAQARLQTEPASTPPLPPPNAAETSVGKKGNATERTENPGPAMPEQKPKTELIDEIQDLATRFARLTESADCLRLAKDWPTGFYMEVPENDEPIDLTENGADRYFGWWMLAMLSEQLDGAWSGSMPAESTWRQAQRQEHGRDEFALQHYMDTILGMPIDPLSLGKRLASASPSVPVWLELGLDTAHAARDLTGTLRGGGAGMNTLPGLPLSDPRHVVALLQHLVDQADLGENLEQLLSVVSPATLEQLKRTPTVELLRLAEQRPAFISVFVDESQLSLARNRLQHILHRKEETLWFIRRGAPAAAMLELFGIPDREYRQLKRMTANASRRGRVRKLDAAVAEQVLRFWRGTRLQSDDLAARFRLLAEQFPDEPLASLWAVFKETTT
jgi:hypothetical protein